MEGSPPPREAYLELLSVWAVRAKRSLEAHYTAARVLSRRHALLGGLLIIVSAITTTLAGRPLLGFPVAKVDNLLTLSSALTLALASLHVFLRDGDRAAEHRRAAAAYSAIKRRLENTVTDIAAGVQLGPDDVASLRTEIDTISENAIGVPKGIWKTNEERGARSAEITLIHRNRE